MDRKLLRNLERSFDRRGGRFGIDVEAPREITRALLEALLECPDCRAAVLEECNAGDREEVDIESVLQDLALADGHLRPRRHCWRGEACPPSLTRPRDVFRAAALS